MMLEKYIDQIEAKREEMADRWIKDPSVTEIFKQYDIAPVKFKDNFGLSIIDYFIAVVRGEKQAGDCPIMTKLVNFLLAKHIVPKEVFLICMGFRRELIDQLFMFECEDMRTIMKEVATLFNANLAGVLDIFENTYKEQRNKMENLLGQDKKFKQILKIINSVKAKIAIVQEGKTLIMNQPFLDLIGMKNVKEVASTYDTQEWGFVKSVDYNSELFYRAFDVWVTQAFEQQESFKMIVHDVRSGHDITLGGVVTQIPDTQPIQYAITMYDVSRHMDKGKEQSNVAENSNADLQDPMQDSEVDNFLSCDVFEANVKHFKEQDPSISSRYAFVLLATRRKRLTPEDNKKILGILKRSSEEGVILGEIEPKVFGIFWKAKTVEDAYKRVLAYEKYMMDYDIVLGYTFSPKKERPKKMIVRGFDLIDSLEEQSIIRLATDNKDIKALQEALIVREKIYAELQDVDSLGITLLYEELPVNVVNHIVSNELGKVTILLDKKQVGILQPGSTVYFLIDSIGFIKGTIGQVDRTMMRATIEKMRIEQDSPLRRKSIRVEATPGMRGRIKYENIDLSGDVMDVNERSIGLKVTDTEGLELGKDLLFYMNLPIEGEMIDFDAPGMIRRIHKFDEDFYVVVVECRLDPNKSEQLKQYVASRQMEIIFEMRKMHNNS